MWQGLNCWEADNAEQQCGQRENENKKQVREIWTSGCSWLYSIYLNNCRDPYIMLKGRRSCLWFYMWKLVGALGCQVTFWVPGGGVGGRRSGKLKYNKIPLRMEELLVEISCLIVTFSFNNSLVSML